MIKANKSLKTLGNAIYSLIPGSIYRSSSNVIDQRNINRSLFLETARVAKVEPWDNKHPNKLQVPPHIGGLKSTLISALPEALTYGEPLLIAVGENNYELNARNTLFGLIAITARVYLQHINNNYLEQGKETESTLRRNIKSMDEVLSKSE